MNTSRHRRHRTAAAAALLAVTLAVAAAAPASAAGYSYTTTLGGNFYVYACESGRSVNIKVVPVTTNSAYEFKVTESGARYAPVTSPWTDQAKSNAVYLSLPTLSTETGVTVNVISRRDGIAGGSGGSAWLKKSLIPNC